MFATVHGVRLLRENDRVIDDYTRRGLPTFEAESMAAWKTALGPEKTAIDVGAYTGLYSIVASRLGASVHALEPNAEAYQRMLANIKANGAEANIRTYPYAAGCCGRGTLVCSRAKMTSGGVVKLDRDGDVIIRRLDKLTIDYPVHAIKIDVEGGETEVLLGALSTIHVYTPLIIAEAHTEMDRTCIMRILKHVGYSFKVADERNLICTI